MMVLIVYFLFTFINQQLLLFDTVIPVGDGGTDAATTTIDVVVVTDSVVVDLVGHWASLFILNTAPV